MRVSSLKTEKHCLILINYYIKKHPKSGGDKKKLHANTINCLKSQQLFRVERIYCDASSGEKKAREQEEASKAF